MKGEFTLRLWVDVTYEFPERLGRGRTIRRAKENLEDLARNAAGGGAFTNDMDDVVTGSWKYGVEVLNEQP
jgi:hypothetical protein